LNAADLLDDAAGKGRFDRREHPSGPGGPAAALAPVYVLLASDEGSYISGARVAVTGGHRSCNSLAVTPPSTRCAWYFRTAIQQEPPVSIIDTQQRSERVKPKAYTCPDCSTIRIQMFRSLDGEGIRPEQVQIRAVNTRSG
jgi:hypothetical protein